jgi:uncharacterized damage-inducible protein DinB
MNFETATFFLVIAVACFFGHPQASPWWNEDFTTSIRSTLQHVIEHELQHRGELNAVLWQIDVEPPILDWDDFEKIEALSSNAEP